MTPVQLRANVARLLRDDPFRERLADLRADLEPEEDLVVGRLLLDVSSVKGHGHGFKSRLIAVLPEDDLSKEYQQFKRSFSCDISHATLNRQHHETMLRGLIGALTPVLSLVDIYLSNYTMQLMQNPDFNYSTYKICTGSR
jgi:hypothetical protein